MFDKQLEDEVVKRGFRFIVGCDEAGRGPLAGPVVGGACYLPKEVVIDGLDDSKKLSPKKREAIFEEIVDRKEIRFGIGIVSPKQIDEINILQASLKAMLDAVDEIGEEVDFIFVDGNRVLKCKTACSAIVKGDSRVASIAAASVIAKVTRDRIMEKLAEAHPEYGFERHKGYPTKDHLIALKKYGPIGEHRMTFAPLKTILRQDKILF